MQHEVSARELNERLDLIQSMIAEGRRSTESWGWAFLLWGMAYSIAIAWASWGGSLSVWGHSYVSMGSVRSGLAWPVTMFTAVVVTLAIGLRKGRPRTATSLVRSIVSIWIAVGIAMLVIFPEFGFTGEARGAQLCRADRSNAWRREWSFRNDLEVEGSDRMRNRLVDHIRCSLLRFCRTTYHCVSGGDLCLPDRLRHLCHDSGVTPEPARDCPCLSFRN
jgi:hypothetical protein